MSSSSKAKTAAPTEGTDAEAVYFWKITEKPYGIFSQWHKRDFELRDADGAVLETFESAEQYMMYQKAVLFNDPATGALIMNAKTSREQKALGRKVEGFDEETWVSNRIRIVEEANYLKFTQHEDLKAILMGTGDREIVEASPRDRIWGVGYGAKNAPKMRGNWGQNLLGIAIMNVRKRIRDEDEGKA